MPTGGGRRHAVLADQRRFERPAGAADGAVRFPADHLPHRALSRFVLSGSAARRQIFTMVVEHFGVLAGKIIMMLYLMAFFPIVLVYSISITNALDSFLIHQFHARAAAAHLAESGGSGGAQSGAAARQSTASWRRWACWCSRCWCS